MNVSVSIIFITYFLVFVVNGEEEDELLAVSLVFRHGDRTPWKFYKNDPYKNSTRWTRPPGELTNVGKLQHYKLGTWFRNRYDNFLSPFYENTDIHVRSSDYDRCLMSASSNLAGLFPPTGSDVWLENFPWQPIPIHTTPTVQDDTIEVKDSCPIYLQLLKKTENEESYFVNLNTKNEKLYEYLSEKSGDNVTSFNEVGDLYDILFIENLKNFTLPEWTQNVFPDKMRESNDACFKILAYTPELARLFIGRFFEELSEQFQFFSGNSTGKTMKKFQMFSGHDDQVYSVLNVLNYPNLHAVPYASTVIFELRRKNQEYYVNFFYKSDEDHADPVELPGCGYDCPLEKFVEIIEPISVTEEEWKEKCP